MIQDIGLSEEAFATAITEFNDLSVRIQNLRQQLEEMMSTLETGFNTPAGRKFIKSCKTNLFIPMNDQKAAFEHIADTLREAKNTYSPVFTEYEALNSAIENVQS